MVIKYKYAEDLQKKAEEISNLMFPNIKLNRIVCLRSFGSSSRRIIARCHALGKVLQLGLQKKGFDVKGFYVIEFISEKFDKLPEKEKIKTIIHELMHIPKSFGGGFRYHDFVNKKNVEKIYNKYISLKNEKKRFWF